MMLFFQVVAGVLIHLTLELGYSTCRKGHDADIDTCELQKVSVKMMVMMLYNIDLLNVCIVLILVCSVISPFPGDKHSV